MCLALPGRLIEMDGTRGQVDFQGAIRLTDLRLVPGVSVGDYVLVHAGFALEIVDQAFNDEYWGYRKEAAERA